MSFYNFVNEDKKVDKKEGKIAQAKRLRADLVTLFKSNKYEDTPGVLKYKNEVKLKVKRVYELWDIEFDNIHAKTEYTIKIDGGEVNLDFFTVLFPRVVDNKLAMNIQKFGFLGGTAELDSVTFKLDQATVKTVLENSRYVTDCTEYFQKTLSSNKEVLDAMKVIKDQADAKQAEEDARQAEHQKNKENFIASAAKKFNTTVDKIVYGADNRFLLIKGEISDSDLKKVKDLFSKYEFYTVYWDRSSEIAAAERQNDEILNKIESIVDFEFHSGI